MRSFLYAGRAYEQLVPDRGRYRKKRIALPYPEFYTFYNGKEKYIKETMLRLSDSYKQDRNSEAMLELIVRVININLYQSRNTKRVLTKKRKRGMQYVNSRLQL